VVRNVAHGERCQARRAHRSCRWPVEKFEPCAYAINKSAPSADQHTACTITTYALCDFGIEVPEHGAVRSLVLLVRVLLLADQVYAAERVKDVGVVVLLKHVEGGPERSGQNDCRE
jgi:hypothetical protein